MINTVMKYNPFTDYDKLGCLKLPWSLYLTLAFLLRGYVIWVVALSNRQEGDALLNLFYPSRHDFTMALLIGLPALLCGALISLRRETMPKFVEWSWYKIRLLMGLSASVQLGYVLNLGHLSLHNLKHITTTYPMIIEMVLLVLVIIYSASNQHFKDVSRQFPREQSE